MYSARIRHHAAATFKRTYIFTEDSKVWNAEVSLESQSDIHFVSALHAGYRCFKMYVSIIQEFIPANDFDINLPRIKCQIYY